MNCIVTAGPTWEPLDQVRRLTNFSTGRLGSELAGHLAARGHQVTFLIGEAATHSRRPAAKRVETFSSNESLRALLDRLSSQPVDAVFHAAAVSDFRFGKVWDQSAGEQLTELVAGKSSSRKGVLLAELIPTAKIIAHLRVWYPRAVLVGWKYEVDGSRPTATSRAQAQSQDHELDATVVNGPAYGDGYGLVTGSGQCAHCQTESTLFEALEALLEKRRSPH